jgi:hypothetical protein
MKCANGYVLLDLECVPETVSMHLVWVCVAVISGITVMVGCVLCTLHMGRLRSSSDSMDIQTESCPASMHSTDPFIEDDLEFKNIVMGSYLDDYSNSLLDEAEEFSAVPIDK